MRRLVATGLGRACSSSLRLSRPAPPPLKLRSDLRAYMDAPVVRMMLDLDSNRWSELDHAYGDASDLPALLRRLSSCDASVMSELFGGVCHQGSIYGASYASVPHLVAAAQTVSDPGLQAEILILVGSIRASKDDRAKAPPAADILRSYEVALSEALALALATLRTPMEAHLSVYLLQAAAALEGYLTLGRVLSGFVDEEFTLRCPSCGRSLYLWPEGDGLSVAADDPVTAPSTKRTQVDRGPIAGSPSAPAYEWLTRVGGRSALDEIGVRLPFLFGSASCPACGRGFVPIDELGG